MVTATTKNGGIMGVGPVDVVIIDFPGNKFSGDIAPAIVELVANGTIRLLDLLFVSKDADGVVTTLSIEDLDPTAGPGFMSLEIAYPGALDADDADELSEDLAPNSSALVVAFENAWASKFTDAIRAADAVVIDQIRIPAAVVEDFLLTR